LRNPSGPRDRVGVARVSQLETGYGGGMHRLLEQQIREATRSDGQFDFARLASHVAATYERVDEERRGIVRSMQLMSDEATALTRELRESTASQLQAILDHVKDVIMTVDSTGHIETMNPTGQRVFGYAEADIIGRPLDYVLPEAGGDLTITDYLDRLAARLDDTTTDLAPHATRGRRSGDAEFDVELSVSKTRFNRRTVYIVCARDTTDRKLAEAALRESEARYRVLVEHAPEVIVVLDVDEQRFVDVNENAVKFFKMDRDALLNAGPKLLSPDAQPDGTPSFGIVRGYLDRALAGDAPVFEWMHCDAFGTVIPCEVRLVRLPASSRRLIRGSITDITERKRSETLAAGEKRVLERMAGNVDLSVTLGAVIEVIERVAPDAIATIRLIDGQPPRLRLAAARSLPQSYAAASVLVPVTARRGSCAAAVYLRRQVIVTEIARDALWEDDRDAPLAAGLAACWSTPIHASDGRILGTLAMYFRTPRNPSTRDFDLMARMTQLAGIAIERRHAEEALRASEARYRELFENVVEGVYRTSLDGRLIAVNPALVRMLGFDSAQQLLAIESTSALYVDAEERVRLMAQLERDGALRNAEYQLRRRDGATITVLENARLICAAGGNAIGHEGTLSDITERKRAETAVFEEKEKAQVTLQSIGDAVITTDAHGRIEYLNPVAEELTGWQSAEVIGRPLTDVFAILNETTRAAVENPVSRCLREGRAIALSDQTVLLNRSGQELAIQDSAAPIRDRSGNMIGAVLVFHDVSRERRLRRALAYQASHDALTGLINRREFESRLMHALEIARSTDDILHALLYLDLDQFKLVNDTCGHQAGDELLKQITNLLRAHVRATDTIARLGGDEFAVLLNDCTAERAARIADDIRQAIRDFRFVWQDGTLNVGVSIGIVEIARDSEGLASVMSAADVACYAAKESGRNRVHMYQHGAAPQRHREMQWVSRLTRACDENRLALYYQPIVPIGDTNDTRGHYELLLRLRDEDGRLVAPAEFIPAAERYNLMPAIDRWVVRQALGTLAHYADESDPAEAYTVAINLSGTSLNDERFLEFLINELQAHDLSPGAVCFEITETAAIANLGNVVHFMRELKRRGCLFSLDDFGSGLSSFVYLKNLPVDFLKIDGQFIQNVTRDHVDRSMVEAIAQIGRAMGIRTVAERVDSEEVYRALASLGIQYAQGFLIAPPEPADALSRITRSSPRLRLVHSR
jgi:diguanylate cyclase (GGDEF)-like protein/PAS domain S-box-containing protein